MIGIILSFFAYTSFAFMDVVNKFLFSTQNIPFFSYMLWLDLAIIFCLLFYVVITKQLSILFFKSKYPISLFIRSSLSVLNTLFSLIAISYLPFHLFYALAFLQPIIASLFAIFLFLEKPKLFNISCIISGFIGILIALEFWQGSLNFKLLGIIAGIGIPITGALSGIMVKKYMVDENTWKIAFYNVILSLLVACLYFIITKEKVYIINDLQIYLLIFIGGLLACIGMVFFMKSYQKGIVQNISIMQYTQIVWGVLFGYILFNNIPSFYNITGLLIIILSSFISIRLKN
jgi:S-adenosylmethionine uptake transporter